MLYYGKGGGISHLTEADCEQAHPDWVKPVVDPFSDEWVQHFGRATRLLEAADWTFAKSMPLTPHWWTIPKKWSNRDAFAYCVMVIRVLAEPVKWKKSTYYKFRSNGWEYWDMDPKTCDPRTCDLINRARIDPGEEPSLFS